MSALIRFSCTFGLSTCMLYYVNYNSMHCLYGELLSASHRIRHTRAAVEAHRHELDVLRCSKSQLARCLMPVNVRVVLCFGLWALMLCSSLVCWVLQGSCQTLFAFLSYLFPVFCGIGACWVAMAICKTFFYFCLFCLCQ